MAREEASEWSWLTLFPQPIRNLPADLTFVLGLVGLTNLAVFLPWVSETVIRVVLGLPLVLFLPGYTLVTALFPEKESSTGTTTGEPTGESGESTDPETGRTGIDGIERVALSFGLSIAVVPLIGLVLNFTPWGIRLVPIVVGLTVFTVGTTVLAAKRRWALPEAERFVVPYRTWLATSRRELFKPETRADAALNVLFVCSVLLATASVGYAVAVPREGEAFTEFYLVTETGDGDLVADDYPTDFRVGETRPIIVGVENHEHERTRYTVVVEVQRVRLENNSTTVLSEQELGQFETPSLADNETWHREYPISPTMEGDRLRLVFLLYRGSPPSEPTVETAYRETHLWINVSSPEG